MSSPRILIASPSPISRGRLSRTLSEHGGADLLGTPGDLSETYVMAESLEPDVVLIGAEFTTRAEFACMKALFAAVGASWLPIADGPSGAAGPWVHDRMSAPDVLDQVAASARLRIRSRHPTGEPTRALGLLRPVGPVAPARPVATAPSRRLIVIGASTGGIDALLTVISDFPADCPPTAIVQHTGRNFSASLIRLLERHCRAHLVAARDGMELEQGMVCVAGGIDGHLRLHPGHPLRCSVQPGPPVSGHMPSVDVLFGSVLPVAPRVVAAILTGMGRDGAEGLLALRRAGATTFGQNEATSVVYGMPRIAQEIGAVERELALEAMGRELVRAAAAPVSAAHRETWT